MLMIDFMFFVQLQLTFSVFLLKIFCSLCYRGKCSSTVRKSCTRKTLSEAGYNVKLKYNPNKEAKQKNRKRKIIQFNPPYSKNVVTKIGHYFLKLLDKHFARQHKLHKTFNKNTVKVTYSCAKNIKSIFSIHNKKVLHQNRLCPNEQNSNCIKEELCPLNGNCQTENIVYKATVIVNKYSPITFLLVKKYFPSTYYLGKKYSRWGKNAPLS